MRQPFGWFSPLLRPAAWFSPLQVNQAWFSRLLVPAQSATIRYYYDMLPAGG